MNDKPKVWLNNKIINWEDGNNDTFLHWLASDNYNGFLDWNTCLWGLVNNIKEDDLERFGEVGKHAPELFEKFMDWYQACQEEGALSKREKALIGLAVSVTIQCPYCIDAYTNSSLENGSNMEQMTEAMHLASAIRGGASLIHGIQSHNAHDKISM